MYDLSTVRVTDALATAGDVLYEVPPGFTFRGFYAAMAAAYMDVLRDARDVLEIWHQEPRERRAQRQGAVRGHHAPDHGQEDPPCRGEGSGSAVEGPSYRVNPRGKDGYAAAVGDWHLRSLGAAIANLMAAATELRLGTCWFWNPMLRSAQRSAMLGMPDHVEIVAVTPLRYHDELPKERPVHPLLVQTELVREDKHKIAALLQGRLALDDLVCYNEYGSRRRGLV